MTGQRWPDVGHDVVEELRRHPGRVALIKGNEHAVTAANRLASLVDQEPLRVGAALAAHPGVTDEHALVRMLSQHLVLTEIDALFWRPRFQLDVLRLLRVLARRRSGVVTVWPGIIAEHAVQYSEPGRVDHVRRGLTDALVLTPLTISFDDDPPFDIKRIP